MASAGRSPSQRDWQGQDKHPSLNPILEHDDSSRDMDLGLRDDSPITPAHSAHSSRRSQRSLHSGFSSINSNEDSIPHLFGHQRTLSQPNHQTSVNDDSLLYRLSRSTSQHRKVSRQSSLLAPQTSFLASEDYTSQRSIPDDTLEEAQGCCGGKCTPRVDGPWSWVIMAASMVNIMLVDGTAFSAGILLKVWVESLKAEETAVSLVSAFINGTYLFAAPLASALISLFGFRPVAMVGSLVAVLGFVAASFAPNVATLVVTYGFMGGIGCSFLYVTSMVGTSLYFDRWRPIAIGLASCGSGIGITIFSAILTSLLKYLDWRNCVRIQAGFFCLGIFSGLLFRPLHTGPRVRDGFIVSFKKAFDLKLFRKLLFWILMIMAFLATLGISIPLQFLPSLASDTVTNSTRDEADFLVTVVGITNTAGRVLVGLTSFWLPLHPLLILGVGLVLGGTVTMLNHLYKTYALLLTYAAFHGVIFALDAALATVIIARTLGTEVLTGAFGLLCFGRGIAGIAGGPIGAALDQQTGSWEGTFYLAGSAVLLTGVLGLMAYVISRKSETRHTSDTSPAGSYNEQDSSNAGSSRESLINPVAKGDMYGSIQEY